MSEGIVIFNRAAVRAHRDRAAVRADAPGFLFDEAATRLAERIEDVRRNFPLALGLGCRMGELRRALGQRGGIETLVECDLSPAMVARTRHVAGVCAVAADEEALPFASGRFDAVLSCLSLHWVNDLPGALIQAQAVLKPDGLFLAAMLGGDTLKELRIALSEAELAEEGGMSPRVSPFAEVRDAGGLLQRAGFALPVADTDTITVSYADPLALMRELSAMGEGNAVRLRRREFTRRATLAAACARYRDRFAGRDGRVSATFQLIFLTGWAPATSQPRPLKPGQAQARLADALGSHEIPAGEKAQP